MNQEVAKYLLKEVHPELLSKMGMEVFIQNPDIVQHYIMHGEIYFDNVKINCPSFKEDSRRYTKKPTINVLGLKVECEPPIQSVDDAYCYDYIYVVSAFATDGVICIGSQLDTLVPNVIKRGMAWADRKDALKVASAFGWGE